MHDATIPAPRDSKAGQEGQNRGEAADRIGQAPGTGRIAALAASAFLLANMVLAIAAPDQMGDHSTGAGRLSEGLVGLSFVAGAVALAALLPRGLWSRIMWIAGIVGLLSSGLTMVAVMVATKEPPVELFLAEVLLAVPALIGVGIVGARRRTWPWWAGLGVALLLPIMFLLPFNSPIMAAVWGAVAWRAVPAPGPKQVLAPDAAGKPGL